jgi:hypothetical protein
MSKITITDPAYRWVTNCDEEDVPDRIAKMTAEYGGQAVTGAPHHPDPKVSVKNFVGIYVPRDAWVKWYMRANHTQKEYVAWTEAARFYREDDILPYPKYKNDN